MRAFLSLIAVAAGLGSAAAATSLNLGQYALTGTYAMPQAANETSAITYNGDRDSFVVIDDEGFDMVEVSRTGQLLGAIKITGHPPQGGLNVQDTESVTYLGNNTYMIGSERNQNAFVFQTTFPAATQTINLSTQASRIQLFGPGNDVGNMGLEGLSYDPLTNSFWGVKEKAPLDIYHFTYDPVTLTPTVARPFSTAQIAALGVTDLSDIQSLGAVPAFAGTDLADNILVLSQESNLLIELDGDGTILSLLSLIGLTDGYADEGVTIDFAGNIYLVAEENNNVVPGNMYVFTAVPEPSEVGCVLGAAGLLIAMHRTIRRRRPVAA